MKMVKEKSCNMKNWPKVIEFCDQSWNLPILSPNCTIFFVTTNKLSHDLENPHFWTFSAKCLECEMVIEKPCLYS